MPAASDQEREYSKKDAVVFRTTSGPFGGLSNMAPGFPLTVSGVRFWTAEALYQCCRFPDAPEVQKLIIAERSPMTAKMKSKRFRQQTRSDWDFVRVRIMKWCLRIKLLQHQRRFGELLRATEMRAIVEESLKDQFWGAKPHENGSLRGNNVLGRLLMELRDEVRRSAEFNHVDPPNIGNFKILEKPVGVVSDSETIDVDASTMPLLNNTDDNGQDIRIVGTLSAEHWADLLHFLRAAGIEPDKASVDLQLQFKRISPTNQSKVDLLSQLARRYGLQFEDRKKR